MCRIAAFLFSVVAAGMLWAGHTAADPVQAADSIPPKSKPASEAQPRTITFSGEVLKGQRFEKPLAENLFFRLVLQELGWTISVGSKAGAGNNFCGVVTPPYRGLNALRIEGWHFRNSDHDGPNELGPKNVNAPQESRGFHFVLDEADYRRAADALQILLWPYGYSRQQIAAAERSHAALPKGSGKLVIRDLTLNALERGKRAGIDRMRFDVSLVFP